MITVFKRGTPVLVDDRLPGKIIAVILNDKDVVYDIGYFLNGEYRTVKLYEYEFSCLEKPRQKIGFK